MSFILTETERIVQGRTSVYLSDFNLSCAYGLRKRISPLGSKYTAREGKEGLASRGRGMIEQKDKYPDQISYDRRGLGCEASDNLLALGMSPLPIWTIRQPIW
jgi:hypothetical protein